MNRNTQQKVELMASFVRAIDLSAAAVFGIVAVIAFLCFIAYGVNLAAHNLKF